MLYTHIYAVKGQQKHDTHIKGILLFIHQLLKPEGAKGLETFTMWDNLNT